MKHRGTKALAMLLSLVMVLSLVPGMSGTAYADSGSDYTFSIPSSLTLQNAGENAAGNISVTALTSGKKLTVSAASTNGWALKSGDNSVGYKLATASTDTEATTSWEFTELSSTATKKDMGIIVEDYSSMPAGTYQDTVTFTASVEDNLVSFTIMRDVNRDSSGNYAVAPGTTWQQFIQSGNAPTCLSIMRGQVWHDMNMSIMDCGGTLIANVADNKHVKPNDVIIDGATYACSDYLGYQDHD